MDKKVLGVDIGGGSIRCTIFAKDKLVALAKQPIKGGIFPIGDYGYGMDADIIWQAVKKGIAKCMQNSNSAELAAIAVSSMRHTLVAIDKDGKVLFASANRDARAVDETMRLNDTYAEEIYNITGHKPMPNLMACKLLWLKNTQKELYDNIAAAFTLSDYIIYKLSGKIGVEKTQAGETCLYDLKKSAWSDELLAKLELNKKMLPPLVECASVAGALTDEVCKELGIKKGAVAVYGAGDTQSALLGLNIKNHGECGIVAGTTMPIQMVVNKPIIDSKQRLWTGVGAMPGTYVLESNAGGSGMALEWVAGLLYQDLPNPVAALMENATRAPYGAGGVVSTVGVSIFNVSVLSLPIDQIFYSTTNHIPDKHDKVNISRGVLEGLAFGVKANIDQLIEVADSQPGKIAIGGGSSQDDIFPKIIAEVMGEEIIRTSFAECSAMGAAICAAVGAGEYKTLAEAVEAMVKVATTFTSKEENYQRIYEEWREIYDASFETNMPLGALITELKAVEGESKASGEKVDLRIYSDADLSPEAIELLQGFGTVVAKNYRDGDMLEGDEMISVLKDYDVFITEVDIVDADIIKALPNLRMIGVCRGNPTNIDIDACSAAGIPVVYTPGRNSEAVADLALAFMLNLARMIPQSTAFLKEEGGQAGDMGRMGAAYFRYQGIELWRKTVGLVGGGAIGKKVTQRLLAFGAKVLVYDPYLSKGEAALIGASKVELDELLASSDIVSLHAPVTKETERMINADSFAKMKDGSYFVNTARAALVDNQALLQALKSGKLAGAALDVFDVEPPAYNDPLVLMENVICTPHIGGNTKQVSIHQGLIIAENIEKLMQGEIGTDVINRKALKGFSFTGEKQVDRKALDNLKSKQTGVSDLDAASAKTEVKVTKKPDIKPQTIEKTTSSGGYMDLIAVFLDNLSKDSEVKQKTTSKDISFQITFKENEESCYMYFKAGDVITGLGEFTTGTPDVCLKMPIEIFDGMMKGTVNGAKAAMTGKMSFTGNVRKAMSMQSILKLMMSSYEQAVKQTGITDITKLAAPAPKAQGGSFGQYMDLIAVFLDNLSKDSEVKQKTTSKDISFQITFKENEESCYMYFKAGDVITGLGEFTTGTPDVCLKMPIEIFDGMMKGTVNGAKAAMTGKMSFTGNVRKAMSMQSILKLMMASYEKAVAQTGLADVSALSAAAPIVEESKVQTAPEAEKVEKQGFLKKLFGKRKACPEQAVIQQQVVYAAPETAKVGDVRDEILQVTNELYAKGLITGIGGNVSARCEDNPSHVWITPSSIFKGDLKADMMVRIDLDGNVVGDTDFSASSEKMVHLAIYKKRPEIMSVVHSHAPKATLMALTNLSFQPVSTDAAFIGDVPIVDFVIPGSPELGDMVADAMGAEGAACLMQNHGLVVCGNSVRRAADNTEIVEITASKVLECHKLGIQPILLPKEAQEELASIGKMLV